MIERSMVAEDAQASKFIWPKKHAEYVEKSAEIQALQSPRRHLQVAVVLAMPSPLHMKAGPRDALHVRRSDDDPHEFERTLEYAIGLVNVPWSSGDVGREASISGRSTSKLVISDPSTLVYC
ncbi:hypothetical protein HETIRDRAFT_420743 [Heterobasidion irregulare TC 32-1]|uniref:Uncharacterized protein n=1 Tax=Heterobasidion irregulare (strain TC 32-1) TaxID=747525 RepID=W4JXW8_HETIT|nr:uncharacterized protein HETIRDRAFT_420743 [Heterobasidion irregulare TC 32-1]ETW77935.1 hypothetical protein HETIRDRAFT_420743 [Heterobasidion irregulare TC 32-1]